MKENDGTKASESAKTAPKSTKQARPCHAANCNCPDWYDPDGDGTCDGANTVGLPGSRCQHPIINHY